MRCDAMENGVKKSGDEERESRKYVSAPRNLFLPFYEYKFRILAVFMRLRNDIARGMC